MKYIRISAFLFIMFAISGNAGCGVQGPVEESFPAEVLLAAKKAPGNFSGTWNLNLKVKKDGCNFGLSKTFDATVVVSQTGKKGTLTLSGFPPYKAKFKGRNLNSKGKANTSGVKIAGKLRGKLAKNDSSIKVKPSKFTVTISGKKCTISFNGSGTKA